MRKSLEEIRISYCMENNSGICPYVHKVCDGLCNNCGLNAGVEDSSGNIVKSHAHNDIEIFFNVLENLIGYAEED